MLKHPSISTSVISEALGHRGEMITQTYLKSFDSEAIDQANQVLLWENRT